MREITKLILAIAVLIAVAGLFGKCSDENETIEIPEIKNEFQEHTPKVIVRDTVFITKWKSKNMVIEVPTLNPVNDSLVQLYMKTKDSLERFKMYLAAVEIKDFTDYYNDDNLELFLHGQVQGTVNWIKPSYVIKKREIPVKQNSPTFKILVGSEILASENQIGLGIRAGVQTKKGAIIGAGFTNIDGENFISAGYSFPLISIPAN